MIQTAWRSSGTLYESGVATIVLHYSPAYFNEGQQFRAVRDGLPAVPHELLNQLCSVESLSQPVLSGCSLAPEAVSLMVHQRGRKFNAMTARALEAAEAGTAARRSGSPRRL